MILVRASQRYIDMFSDFRFFRSQQLINEMLRENTGGFRAAPCMRQAIGDTVSLTLEQQESIREAMSHEYQQYISDNIQPKGMIYLIDLAHEYLVFTNSKSFLVVPASYAVDIDYINRHCTDVIYHE